jgi:hypothetical protein
MGKLITLAEARVRFIRAYDPALAEKAASLEGVLRAKDVLLQEPASRKGAKYTLPVSARRALGHARALANTKLLEAFDDAVRAYRIRLWGTLDRSKPATWLDELEQQIGKMEVLENTMTCDGRVWLDLRADEDEINQEIARRTGTVPAQEVPDASPPLPEGEAVPVVSAAVSPAPAANTALPAEGGETAHKENTSGAPVQPKRRSRRKRDRAENVANKIWGGPPPDHLTAAEVIQQVSKGLKDEYKLSDTDINSYASTILRATGRRDDRRKA